jgi:hypothetical protein
MACLFALTVLAMLATGVVSFRRCALQSPRRVIILAPLNRLLDRLGHDAGALAQANESPSL